MKTGSPVLFSTLSSTLRTVIDILDEVTERQRSGTSGPLDLMDFDSIRTIAHAIATRTTAGDLDATADGASRAVEELEAFTNDSPTTEDPVRASLWRQTQTMLRTMAIALDNERNGQDHAEHPTDVLTSDIAAEIAARVTMDSVERVRFTFDATWNDVTFR